MEFESSGLSKEEIRKRRRKKERTQALAILVGAVLVVCLVLGIGIAALVNVFSSSNEKEDNAAVDAVTASVVPEESDADIDGDTSGVQTEDEAEETMDSREDDAGEVTEDESTGTVAESTETDTENEEETGPDADLSEEELLEEKVAQKIAGMSIEQKVAALFFVTPGQLMGTESIVTTVGSSFGERILEYPVGGIVLDNSNITTGDELSVLISNIRMYGQDDIFIGVTNEGGEASPFVASGITENIISSKKEIGESLGASGAYSAGISLGSELKQYGFDVNLAPSVDVSLKAGSVAERNGFGTDMTTTAELGKNMISGMVDQKIHAAVGFFPSYGDVTHSGESGQVTSQRSLEDLKKESQPYLDAIDAGAEFVMVSHVGLPRVRGDNRPASLSPEIITDIIRTEWEYDGIVITDYMNRSCMYQKYTYAEAAAGAIEAGADMILSPKNFEKSYNGILDAVKNGKITEERIDESLTRIYRVKLAG